MEQILKICMIIIKIIYINITNAKRFDLQYDISTYDAYLPNVTFIQNTAYSFYQCMDICNRFTYCKSVNYHKGTKMCTLNYQAADPPGTIQPRYSTVPMAGYRYMEKASFPAVLLAEECIGHSCINENLCSGSKQCTKWLYNDCGMVDEDEFAITVYPVNGDFNTAIHTCLRAPPGFSGVTTRKCNNKTGLWSSPLVPCPTYCLRPPKVHINQQLTFQYPGGNLVRVYYSCSSYTDTQVKSSCLRTECEAEENWSWGMPVALSCSPNDCWTPGTYYRGGVSCTVSGRTCQRWDTNYPQNRVYIPENPSAQHNYCRIDGDTKPWCYTTDPAVRWEYCDVQMC